LPESTQMLMGSNLTVNTKRQLTGSQNKKCPTSFKINDINVALGMALIWNKAHFYIRHQLRTTKLRTTKFPPIIHSRNKFGAITII